jgi:hypothetical protein
MGDDVSTQTGAQVPAPQSNTPELYPNGGQGGGVATTSESYADLIMAEMTMLDQVLSRVAAEVQVLADTAGQLDETITRVDEEAGRVEAPTATIAATDAANTVGVMIVEFVADLAVRTASTQLLNHHAREGMKPTLAVQDRQRQIGAGPKLLATAGK